MSKQNLKALALAPMAGFRKKTVVVPEWNGAEVTLREPSAEAWIRWQSLIKQDSDVELSIAETAQRNLKADVSLFVDVLLDDDMQQVFSLDDIAQVEAIYGPVHSRLLKLALDLITAAGDAKAK
ncbi:phage tail protein [Pluralibacter gergoviae]|uniref:phage tail assembly chaperone n=1 Tax=Pluralibacter gergoviae TaxID=61647 RepID=UPI0008DC0137|nr:phage tail assembly chaperone [Pluralibacter gergoviae]OHY63786.1 phage tail protein [Pluralibacter gergoviae]